MSKPVETDPGPPAEAAGTLELHELEPVQLSASPPRSYLDLEIGVCLIVAIAAITVVTIVSGSQALTASRLVELAILLGGALAGTKIPR